MLGTPVMGIIASVMSLAGVLEFHEQVYWNSTSRFT
jgi:hypothetical protein